MYVAAPATPPACPVQSAFSEVNSARAEKERLQLEAQQFANELIPQAEGEAQRITNEAEAYSFRVVQVAQGEPLLGPPEPPGSCRPLPRW